MNIIKISSKTFQEENQWLAKLVQDYYNLIILPEPSEFQERRIEDILGLAIYDQELSDWIGKVDDLIADKIDLFDYKKIPPLSQWLKVNNFEVVKTLREAGWLPYEQVFGKAELALVRRFSTKQEKQKIKWAKHIDLDIQLAYCRPTLVIELTQSAEQTIWILPRVRPVGLVNRKLCLPEGLKLMVLDESGETWVQQQAGKADNLIGLGKAFTDSLGARFSIQITLGKTSFTESFII